MKSEMSEHHPKARKYRVEPEDFLSVCTKCFGLTSQGQNYQHCECEPTPTIRIPEVDCPNGFSLCFLCARDIAGGITRWSWLVCKTCLQVARGKRVNGVQLPLGRHSIMNGYSWSIQSDIDSNVDQIASDLLGIFEWSSHFESFAIHQARNLFQAEPRVENLPLVSMGDWKRYFPSSRESSVEALKEFRRWVRLNTKQDEQTRNRNRSGTAVKES